jgi:multiple sugar transport system permease protein
MAFRREAVLAGLNQRHRHGAVALGFRGLRTVILMMFALFFAVPLLWLLLATTKSGEQLQLGAPLGLGSLHQLVRNWQALTGINGDAYMGWFGNSVEYVLGALFIVLLVDVPAGYGLAICDQRWRRPLLGTTLVLMLIPNTVLVLPLFLEMNGAHLIGNPLSVILPFSFFPFGVFLAYLYFSTSMPRDALDAARIDGCSELQVFLRVALPLSKPVIALIALFSFVANWNNYFLPLLMLPSSDGYPLQVGLADLPRGSPVLALGTLVSALPVMIIFIISSRYFLAGLTAGSTTD